MVIQQLNVFDGLKYSRIVLQFHGLIGFRYKNGRLIESRFLKIVPVLYMIAFSISMSIGFIFSQIRDLQEHPEGDQDEGSLRNIISMAELVFVIFGFFVFVISSRLNLKDHIKFIDDVNSIDELFLKHFNTGVNYRSFRARNITALTVCVVLNFVVISSVVKVDFVTLQHFEEYFFAGAYLLENSLAIMVSVTFIQYLNLIRYHFIALNDCIESTRLHIQENYLEYGYLKEPMITKVNNDIKIIYKLYRDICSSIETFNRFFGTMMAISILHDIALTLSLLYVYMTIINIQGNISSLPLFSILVWMFPNFAKLMATSISAEMIQDTVIITWILCEFFNIFLTFTGS